MMVWHPAHESLVVSVRTYTVGGKNLGVARSRQFDFRRLLRAAVERPCRTAGAGGVQHISVGACDGEN